MHGPCGMRGGGGGVAIAGAVAIAVEKVEKSLTPCLSEHNMILLSQAWNQGSTDMSSLRSPQSRDSGCMNRFSPKIGSMISK